jgi:predicted dehydrogenase/sugar phosphate isomerase/epimerase
MKIINTRLGISTLVFRELNLNDALENISRMKVEKIDLTIILPTFCPHYNPLLTKKDDDLQLKDLINSFAYTVSTLNIVPGYFNVEDPERVEYFVKRSIDIAALLGAHSITMPSGAKVELKKWEENVLLVKKHLIELSKYANDNGVSISIETPHVRTLTETVKETKRFHDILDEPKIKCTLDTSHVGRLGKLRISDAVKYIGSARINHVHLRDVFGEDIDFTPGKGNCDFISFFKYMKNNSYTGDYILELEYEDINENQKAKEIDFAIEYCNEILNNRRLSLSIKLQTTGIFKFVERVKRNPKAEIKRHKRLLSFVKIVKTKIKPYVPEKVYEGRWRTKVRWNKGRVVRHQKNSVKLAYKSNRVVKVGIVGCGYAGRKMHAPGFQRLKDVEIIGVYDLDQEKTKICAKAFGAKACASLGELILRCKPDLLSVCSREWAHYEIVMAALTNGVDVFCEKLLATRYNDALKMVNTAKKYNRVLGVNYNYHYMPGIKKIKEVIVQQALGKLAFLNINVHAFSYAHALDLLSFLGGKIISVSAYYKNDDSIRQFGGTDWRVYDEDILYIPSIAISVTVEFEKGTIGIVNSSYYYNLHSFILSIEAVFESGVISLSGINMYNVLGNLSFFSSGRIRKVDMNYKRNVYAKGYEYTFYESIKDFMDCYVAGKPVPTTGERALFNMKLEKIISISNLNHEKIYLNQDHKIGHQ